MAVASWSPLGKVMTAGANKVNSMISAASSGNGGASSGIGSMRSDANSMREQASIVNSQAASLNASAGKLEDLVPELNPYRAELEDTGGDLTTWGDTLTLRANDIFGHGEALMNLDPTKGGLSAEYIKQFNSLSPEQFVSRAASDVQGSFENAKGQQDRDLSRRGVSLSSGAAAALKQKLYRALASASAAAKTDAWQKGKDAQTSMLDKMATASKAFHDMGNETQQQGITAKAYAIEAQKGAADIVSKQGTLLKDAGSLRASAGELFASAATIFGNAAQAENNAAQLSLDSAKNLMTAYATAVDYYSGLGKSMISADAAITSGQIQADASVARAIANM